MDHSIFKIALVNRVIGVHFKAHAIRLLILIDLPSELSATLTLLESSLQSSFVFWLYFLVLSVKMTEVVIRAHVFINLFDSGISDVFDDVFVITHSEAMVDLFNEAFHFFSQFGADIILK
jgi:hypothetical protein